MLLTEKYKTRLQELAGVKILSEADNRRIMIDKMGIEPEIAEQIHKLSPKYSIWIANQVVNYPSDDTVYEDELSNNFDYILDWKKGNPNINLNYYDFVSAMEAATDWHDQSYKVHDVEMQNKNIVLQTGPYFWVKLSTEEDCREEGQAMGHCIGDEKIGHPYQVASGRVLAFSMRDSNNKPHITLEILKNGDIVEFKGKENKIPIAKYMPYAIEFLLKKKELWKKITDNTFWKALDKPMAKMLYEKLPKIFSFGLKIKYNLPLNKEEQEKYDEMEEFFVGEFKQCKEVKSEEYPNSIFLKKGDDVLFEIEKFKKLQESKNGNFWVKYGGIWSVFEKKYRLNYQQTQSFIEHQVEKHLKLYGFTPLNTIVKTMFQWKNI